MTLRVLLDTSAYSAFMRGHPEIQQALQDPDEIYLNPITLGELFSGFMRGKHRKRNEKLLSEFLSSPRVKIIPIDEATAERYAVILNSLWEQGTPVPTYDLWISASAMQHGLRVLTTADHYLKIPQILVDHFSV